MKWWSDILAWLGFGPAVEAPVVNRCATEEHSAERDDTELHPDESDTPEQKWWIPEGPRIIEPPRMCLNDNAADQSLTRELQTFIESPEIDLPHLPHVAQRVLTALRQPNINYPGIAKVLSQDQTLSASVLRMANSAAFGGQDITNIEVALSRLGMKHIRNLMIKESLKALTIIKTSGGVTTAERLWKKSVACSVIMEHLATLYEVKADEAFLLGLLHDIGEVVLLRVTHDYERLTKQQIPPRVFEYVCQEYHQEFGGILAESWNLPSAIRPVIRQHHGTVSPDDRYATRKCLVQISDMLADLMGHGPGHPYDLLNTPAARRVDFGQQPNHFDVLEYLPGLVRVELSLAF